MHKKAHWDSEKEYKEFWSKSKTGYVESPYQSQYAKKRKRLWPFLILSFVIVLAVSIGLVMIHQGRYSYSYTDKNSYYSKSQVQLDVTIIPEFTGEDYVVLNDNMPNFNEYDMHNITGENYSELDELGRCGAAVAMLHQSMMPAEERGEIGHIKPSGWVQEKYEGIIDSAPPYLYNRCHLIAYALTGQNANERNLITGTRYMNVDVMLPWEEKVMRYLDDSENHVLYRVTPWFKDDELVARGVEMEAYSVEDEGEGVCFHVFVYNYQPGVEMDYRTGESWVK